MVTEHYNNLNTVYHDQTYWRMHVITRSVILICLQQWSEMDYHSRHYMSEIMNQDFRISKPLNKW